MNAVPSTARRSRRLLNATLAAVIGAGVMSAAATAAPIPLPEAPNCPVFPANSHWNLPVDKLPKLNGSKRIVDSIGARSNLHNNFGGGTWKGSPDGMPITVVGGNQPKVPVRFVEHQWSDPGPYPIPPNAGVEYFGDPDADHHVILVDRDSCRLYETYDSKKLAGGRLWSAYAGATWNLRSNALRPDGWTSADGAGLPMLPGLVRHEEIERGRIDHAIRFAVPATRKGWIYPARHDVTDETNPNLPQMGQRLRLKKNFNVKPFPRQSRIVLKAMKKYGMIVADHGPAWYYSGEPDPGFSYEDLHSLHRVLGKNFEVVDSTKLPRPGE